MSEDFFDNKARAEIERLLKQVPPEQQVMIQTSAAKGAARLNEQLNYDHPIGGIFGWHDPTASLVQLVREQSLHKFHGERFRAVFGKTADLLEEGVTLRPALLLAWVTYEVDEYLKASQKAENAAQKPRQRLA
jgi:hypothetical protein